MQRNEGTWEGKCNLVEAKLYLDMQEGQDGVDMDEQRYEDEFEWDINGE